MIYLIIAVVVMASIVVAQRGLTTTAEHQRRSEKARELVAAEARLTAAKIMHMNAQARKLEAEAEQLEARWRRTRDYSVVKERNIAAHMWSESMPGFKRFEKADGLKSLLIGVESIRVDTGGFMTEPESFVINKPRWPTMVEIESSETVELKGRQQ